MPFSGSNPRRHKKKTPMCHRTKCAKGIKKGFYPFAVPEAQSIRFSLFDRGTALHLHFICHRQRSGSGTLSSGSNPRRHKKKTPKGVFFLWQREKDSNPHKQSQSLLCYPYTIPLCDFQHCYYNKVFLFCQLFFIFFIKNFKGE